MSERKEQREHRPQGKSIPLRVRFRSPSEQAAHTNGNGIHSIASTTVQVPDLFSVTERQRHSQQIKELLRLGSLLRVESGLSEVLQHVVASMSACSGFRMLVVNLVQENDAYVRPLAFTGLSEEQQHFIIENPVSLEQLQRLMHPTFLISQSYFIPFQQQHLFQDIASLVSLSQETYIEGRWHPQDELLIPLFSPRDSKLLGFFSLDDPADGKRPTLEGIEVIELFANQAAIAIDNARIFQEREAERLLLEEGIVQLREDMEQIQRGDLRMRIRPLPQKLQPIGKAMNAMTETISDILGNVQQMTYAADEHMRNVQRTSAFLVRDTIQQERQVHQISTAIRDIAEVLHQVYERAEELSRRALEAMEVTMDGQTAIDRAVDGMGKVRETAMQSTRTMKKLGESGQEINKAVTDVADLTTRMHLLALNAAIEATRSGENGKGFAVIAQEIRSLAMHSSEAARKIGTYIRTIQHETGVVSYGFEQNTQQVVRQTELVMQTGVALEAISIVTEHMANLIQGICATTESQDQGSQIVVSAVAEILLMTSDITQHMREMQRSLADLTTLSNSVRARLSVFRI